MCLLLCFCLLTIVGEYRVSAQNSRIQFVNLSTALISADVYVDGIKLNDNLPLYAGTSFHFLSPNINSSVVVAPENSNSAAEGLCSLNLGLKPDSTYIMVIYDNLASTPVSPALLLLRDVKTIANNPLLSDVVFTHVTPLVSSINVVLRTGGMIVGDLSFGNTAPSVSLPLEDNFIDVKLFGSLDILSTYRVSLQGAAGKVSRIFVTGTAETANTLKLFILDEDGFLFSVDRAPVARVQYINVLADTVDVFKNGSLFANNAKYGDATPYKHIPGELNMNIAVSAWQSLNANNPYSVFPFVFDNAATYTAVSAGSITNVTYPLQLYFHNQSKEDAPDSNSVSVLFFQGDYTDNTMRVEDESGNVLFDTVSYGNFSGYQTLTASSHSFKVYNTVTNALLYQTSPINFADVKGKSVTLIAADNKEEEGQTDLWRVNTDGVSYLLSSSVGLWELNTHHIYVAPNPIQRFMTIQSDLDNLGSDNNTYTIIDQLGRTVRSNASFSIGEKIDLQGLSNGTYFLMVRNSQNTTTTKILIQQ